MDVVFLSLSWVCGERNAHLKADPPVVAWAANFGNLSILMGNYIRLIATYYIFVDMVFFNKFCVKELTETIDDEY